MRLARNHHLGKPLWEDLQGHSRITYGRLRCIVRLADGIAVVVVVYVGLRKEDSDEDVYEAAHKALQRNSGEIEQMLLRMVKSINEESKSVSPLRRTQNEGS